MEKRKPTYQQALALEKAQAARRRNLRVRRERLEPDPSDAAYVRDLWPLRHKKQVRVALRQKVRWMRDHRS